MLKIFLVTVTGLGALAIGHSIYSLYRAPVPKQWFLLALLTLLKAGGSITVKLPSVPPMLSVSETFVFTSVLLFGTAAGTITVTLDGLIISLCFHRRQLELKQAHLQHHSSSAIYLGCISPLLWTHGKQPDKRISSECHVDPAKSFHLSK